MNANKKTYEFSKWNDDLIFLRNTLAETLTELGLPEIAAILPWGNEMPENISLPLSERAIQTYSLCFHLLNMVEENTSNQIRRENGYQGEGLWEDVFENFKKSDENLDSINARLRNVSIEPVLTAHPTEAKRATVLEHNRRLYLLLVKYENKMWSDAERELIRDEIKVVLERLLRTGDLYLERPEVSDELRNITYYLESVFPDAIQVLYKRFRKAWEISFSEDASKGNYPIFPSLTFGTWVGGDRDGHPFVTSLVTKETLLTLRSIALKTLSDQLVTLTKHLSLNDRLQTVPDTFKERTDELIVLCGDYAQAALERNPGEPWRQYLNLLLTRLPSSDGTKLPHYYVKPEDLISDLEILKNSLIDIGAKRIAQAEVEPLILICKSFGFHLAKLDIRQNSAFHDKAIEQILEASVMLSSEVDNIKFHEWDVAKRISFLNQELSQRRPFLQPSVSVGHEGDEIRKTLRVIAEHGESFGFDGIGSLIVSMTRDLSDLLSVYVLAKESELAKFTKEGLSCPIPVVPLFETISDLERSFSVVEEFISHPVTKLSNSSIHACIQTGLTQNNVYDIMIGYSDSSKDGGVFSSYWNLYQTQEKLISLGSENGVKFRFFHGRGGTISRGAGPTGRFLAALPAHSLSPGLRMTEQGETISQKYANLLTASYNLELLQAGVAFYGKDSNSHTTATQDISKAMNLISKNSQNAYQELLSRDGFIRFFREATPIDVIEHSRYGSRPPKRRGADSLDDLRAIPWVFSWNQARFFLSSWYGVGSALSQLKNSDQDLWNALVPIVKTWAPARYIFTNLESSIFSASEFFMKEYSNLVVDSSIKTSFLGSILNERSQCIAMLAELFQDDFAKRRPRLLKTLEYREKPLEILHLTQIDLLDKWRKNGNEELLSQLLLVTNAIAGGLRTTG